jgi:hypothetical protein
MRCEQQAVVPTRGEDISPEYVALEAKRNAYGELKKLLVIDTLYPLCASDRHGENMHCSAPSFTSF